MNKKISAIIAAVFALLLIGISFSNGLFHIKRNATSVEDRILSTLDQLNASDAIFLEAYNPGEIDFLIYRSKSTGNDYTFRASTGVLASITKSDTAENPASVSTYSIPVSDEKRKEIILDYVSTVFSASQIGQFEFVHEHFDNIDYHYNVKEFYDGIETGTSAYILCTPSGEVTHCMVRYGTIFTKHKDGSVTLNNNDPLIGEETAIANARDFVSEHALERGYILQSETADCSIKANENIQYYDVRLTTKNADDYVVTYEVWVDVHTGEIQFFQFTQ